MYYLKIEDYVNNIDDILAHINKRRRGNAFRTL